MGERRRRQAWLRALAADSLASALPWQAMNPEASQRAHAASLRAPRERERTAAACAAEPSAGVRTASRPALRLVRVGEESRPWPPGQRKQRSRRTPVRC